MMRGRPTLLLTALAVGLLAPSAPAADPAAIRKAMERGVAGLKRLQRSNDGTWPHLEIGATALAGLALLECNVPANDPAIQKAAAAVRQVALSEIRTYSLALSIMFLDRLGDPSDIPLIEVMALRLLAGQKAAGGWSYTCTLPVGRAELQHLQMLVKERSQLVTGQGKPPKPANRPPRGELPRDLQQLFSQLKRGGIEDPRDDNSNTQFAVLALWIARRHGIPIEEAAARIEQRFRNSQLPNGGWGYFVTDPLSTPAMTCAGLLGLAISHGAAKEAANGQAPPEPGKDPVLRAGLVALGSAIDHPAARRPGNPHVGAVGNGRFFYFLWSLERVAMIYGLETIGGKDWYTWGAEILLASQRPEGLWVGDFGTYGADTCFALLFLARANPARDLAATLKGSVQDPGEVVLRTGGVSGASLQPRPASPPEPSKPGEDSPPSAGPASGPRERAGAPLSASSSRPTPATHPQPSPAGEDDEAARLTARLLEARGPRLDEMLAQMKEARGVAYTQALAAAIPRLHGSAREHARAALAERLARMSSATLADKLQDDDLEVRRAAALAVAMKDDKSHLRKLIDLLEDREPLVARAAHAALKSLTGQDFGPAPDAGPAERARAAAAWKEWWHKQGNK